MERETISHEEWAGHVTAAGKEFAKAKTADDVRAVWKAHVGALGHRTLARLLNGWDAQKMIERRAA